MNLKYCYWRWEGALSSQTCDKIIDAGLSKRSETAQTSLDGSKKVLATNDVKKLLKIRNSNVVFLNNQWIFDIIHSYLHQANKNAEWNFQYDFTESMQFTIYGKKQHYTWHNDCFPEPYSLDHPFKTYRGKIRKISCVVQLSDPKKFKGGELELDFGRKGNKNTSSIKVDKPFNTKRGSIIFFPSFVWHRVKPVTKGTRYSLVCWTIGNPFV